MRRYVPTGQADFCKKFVMESAALVTSDSPGWADPNPSVERTKSFVRDETISEILKEPA